MHRIAVYPGTFDPMTNGHLDVTERATRLFDKVIVGVSTNSSKTPLFSVDERVELIKTAVADLKTVDVIRFDGLLVDFAQQQNAVALVRGLRAISDFEYEFQMALMNRKISEELTTVFLMPHEKYTYLNSTIVKELAHFGGDFADFVPKHIAEAVSDRMNRK